MVILRARQLGTEQSLEAARSHVLQAGELGYIIVSTRRYLCVGDGVRTLGALLDSGEYLPVDGDIQTGPGWLSGLGDPVDGIGDDGWFYLERDARAFWGPKTSGSWSGTGPISLVGDPGASIARVPASGETPVQTRAIVPAVGQFAILVEGFERYVVIGDGVTSIGDLVDGGEYFATVGLTP